MRGYLILMLALGAALAMFAGCSDNADPLAPTADPNPVSALAAQAVPADASIDSARFWFRVAGTDSQTVTVHPITAAWTEMGVTYNSLAGAFDPTALATLAMADTGWQAVDVTGPAQGWFDGSVDNFGFLLQPIATDTAHTLISSRESNNIPWLEVFYTAWDGSFADTTEVIADAHVYSAQPDVNSGGVPFMTVGRDVGVDSIFQTLMQFGYEVSVRYSTISDFVWVDENGDGIQDAAELGLPGVTVNLYNCAEEMIATTVTDDQGGYMFEMLPAGDYFLEFVTPSSFLASPMDQGGDDSVDSDADPTTGRTACFTTLPGATYTGVAAGFFPAPVSVGDFVWNDENMNGLQDEGELGMADIEVKLYACDGEMVAMTMTDADGWYLFEELEAGEYHLEFVNPFGYIFTYPDEGDDDALDSDVDQYQKRTVCFVLEAGDEATGWDAGLFAFEGCTYSKGYWKNHAGFGPQADVLSMHLPLWLGSDGGSKSMFVDNAEMAVAVLHQHEYDHPSNGITKLYAQLLAAKLNIHNFANPADVADAMDEADAFLADYDWTDWDMLDREDRQMVLDWKDVFDQYNNGMIGPGHCDDDDMDDDDDDDDMDDDSDDMN